MSDRQTTPISDSLGDWRKGVDSAIQTLQQRPIGAGNGLIVPGGGAGTWVDIGSPGSSYGTNWGSFGGPSVRHPQYVMDADGFVHFRGHVLNTVGWAGEILVIPYKVTPIESFACACVGAAGAAGIAIVQTASDGSLNFALSSIGWASANYISLSGITYYAGGQ